MDKELEKLIDEINFFQQYENVDFDQFDKIKGKSKIPIPGDKVELFWEDREESDKGYIFQLPHQVTDEYDLCIHFTDIDNSDGIDSVEDEFHHIYHICSLERVKKLLILET